AIRRPSIVRQFSVGPMAALCWSELQAASSRPDTNTPARARASPRTADNERIMGAVRASGPILVWKTREEHSRSAGGPKWDTEPPSLDRAGGRGHPERRGDLVRAATRTLVLQGTARPTCLRLHRRPVRRVPGARRLGRSAGDSPSPRLALANEHPAIAIDCRHLDCRDQRPDSADRLTAPDRDSPARLRLPLPLPGGGGRSGPWPLARPGGGCRQLPAR